MFESLKCLCWSWDPTLQTAAQRTVLPLCGKAKLTETVCVWVLKLALQLKRPGVPLPRLIPPQLRDYKTGAPGLAIFSAFWSALRRFRLWKPTEKLYDGDASEFQPFVDCLFGYLLRRNSPPSPNASIVTLSSQLPPPQC